MKQLILIEVLLCCFSSLKAQDTLIFRSGNKILAKVLEIGIETIKYKKLDNPSSLEYIEKKSDILLVKFNNGLTEEFSNIKAQDSLITRQSINHNDSDNKCSKLFFYKGDYHFTDIDGKPDKKMLEDDEVLMYTDQLSSRKSILTLKELTQEVRLNIKRKKQFEIIGIPTMGLSGLILFYSFSVSSYNSENGNNGLAKKGLILSSCVLATGFSFQMVSLSNKIQKKKRMEKAIKIYNQNI